jgi:hypothetical protein
MAFFIISAAELLLMAYRLPSPWWELGRNSKQYTANSQQAIDSGQFIIQNS